MTPPLHLHGIVPPVATPYDPQGQIDPDSLRRVLRHLLDGGVHGLFVLGSTSECVFLTAAQRAEVVRIAVEVAQGRVPVVAGVMDATTDHCIAHGRQARALGAQALVLTAPYYTRTNQAETQDHFRYVRDAVDLPVIAYDIPVCVNIKLARDTVNTLARENVVVALKDSSGDEGNFRMLLRDLADLPDFALFTGSEIVCDAALLGGAHGIVPGLANVDPRGYVRLYDHARAGRWSEARAEQERLISLFQMVFFAAQDLSAGASGVGSFKTALKLMGLARSHHMARPNRPLPPAAVERVRQHLVAHGLLAA
ncbi:MAG: dihydrodipicolinate synthase family protein [Rhodoferax sp.]|jgi:4-hydroxy-tetrahydrodipicolinate synthase|nr:dihydrodipicolinate synthase family protein [Rhodoferax sp.]